MGTCRPQSIKPFQKKFFIVRAAHRRRMDVQKALLMRPALASKSHSLAHSQRLIPLISPQCLWNMKPLVIERKEGKRTIPALVRAIWVDGTPAGGAKKHVGFSRPTTARLRVLPFYLRRRQPQRNNLARGRATKRRPGTEAGSITMRLVDSPTSGVGTGTPRVRGGGARGAAV